jgi:hypothetical protein
MMLNPPQTRREAVRIRYGVSFCSYGYRYEQCAYEVYPQERGPIPHQCNRKPGHGPDRLYCPQHAKEVAAVLSARVAGKKKSHLG